MLADYPAVPVLAVTDLERARQFYEGVLGLTSSQPSAEGVVYDVAGGHLLVYRSSYAGTNRATAVGFSIPADAFDAEAADLRARGVTFQTYEMPDVTWIDGVADFGGMKSAWFEDPDGNILNIETGNDAGDGAPAPS